MALKNLGCNPTRKFNGFCLRGLKRGLATIRLKKIEQIVVFYHCWVKPNNRSILLQVTAPSVYGPYVQTSHTNPRLVLTIVEDRFSPLVPLPPWPLWLYI